MEEIIHDDLELEANSSKTCLGNIDANSYHVSEYAYDSDSVIEYGPDFESDDESPEFISILRRLLSDYIDGPDSESDNELPVRDLAPKIDIEKVIQSLPTILIDFKRLSENKKCIICLEKFELKKYAKLLPCGHYYHETCIKCWLDERKTCPCCRKDVSYMFF